MKSFLSKSDEQTKRYANSFAKQGKCRVIGLTGELGAGKTTFVQGFAKGLGIKDKIVSPTFVLIRQHKVPNSKKMLFHIDLYRLENMDNIKHLGIEEILDDPSNIVLIEWAEKIKSMLPKLTWWISFKCLSQEERLITLSHTPSL